MHFKLNIRRYSPISHFHKIVNIMRLSLVLCMLTIFCASATVSYSQVNEISLHLEDATLEQALEAIKQQSEYSFWYRNDEINLGRKVSVNINNQNLLHPFYMVYISHEGEVLCDHLSPKTMLDNMRAACRGKHAPDKKLCSVFNKETKDGREMSHYSDLLQEAIHSIIEVKEESDIMSLFSAGETTALRNKISGLDDFELICFLVIK
jgi:hypothetical protein